MLGSMSWKGHMLLLCAAMHAHIAKPALHPPTGSILVAPGDTWEDTLLAAEPGSVIAFAPGTYASACDIQLRKNISLVGIEGAAATAIDCHSANRHLHITGAAQVRIEGLSFINGSRTDGAGSNSGGCILVDGGSHLVVADSIFSHCFAEASGGAIAVVASKLEITGMDCHSCAALRSGGCIAMVNSSGMVSASTFVGCDAEQHGGGMYLERSVLSMKQCSLRMNAAGDRGGGVSGHTESDMDISASSFDANVCGLFMGAEIAEDFRPGHGGGVYAQASRVRVHDDVFLTRNHADFGGAALSCELGCEMHVSGRVEMRGNVAGTRGGGLDCFESACFVSDNVIVADNIAGSALYVPNPAWVGGGVQCGARAHCELWNGVRITGNYAVYGGAVMSTFGSFLSMSDDVELSNNLGLIFAPGVALWMDVVWDARDNVRLIGNRQVVDCAQGSCQYGGGGVIARTSWLNFDGNVEIAQNFGAVGGGMYLMNSDLVARQGLRVKQNLADAQGGGIFADMISLVHFIGGGEVSGNTAKSWGAGIVMLEGSTLISSGQVTVSGNVAQGGSGGGLYVVQSTVNATDMTYSGNMATGGGGGMALENGAVAVCTRCEVSSNSAQFGGGIACSGALTLVGCTFRSNQASRDGGGLYLHGPSQMSVHGSEISGCRAGRNGGGLALLDDSHSVLASGVRIWGNSAGNTGGGVQAQGLRLDVDGDGLLLAANVAAQDGGGIFFASPVRIHGAQATVRDNRALLGSGGGACGEGWKAELVVSAKQRLHIANNSAVDGGGVALLELARLMVTPLACPAECTAASGDGVCDWPCMKPGCNFDGGDCSHIFEEAGADAAQPCNRVQCHQQVQRDWSICNSLCLRASCDFHVGNPTCNSTIAFARECPLFDAQAWGSVRAQPNLTFVKPGGTAEGFGRCTTPCSKAPPPPLPDWCTSEACVGDGPSEDGWCRTIDDGGDVLKPECDACSLTLNLGPSWGYCSVNTPRLPGHGFDYDPSEMARVLAMPLFELLLEYPACGSLSVVFTENRAAMNGGALFKSRCNAMSERADTCMVEGLVGSSYVAFHNNTAGAAGGAAYTACHTFGDCAAGKGLSREQDSVFFFNGNKAGTFGNDVASGPMNLVLTDVDAAAVPGQEDLKFTFALQDAQQQAMRSGQTFTLPFLISASICAAAEKECSKTTSLQPDTFFSLPPGVAEASAALFSQPLRYCKVGVDAVQVRLSVIGGGVQEISSLSKTFAIKCEPCQLGQTMRVVQEGGKQLWTCGECEENQYIINSSIPDVKCQTCPVGGRCERGRFEPIQENAVWERNEELGIFELKACPGGHEVVNDADGEFQQQLQQCLPCAPGYECTEELCTSCTACQPGFLKAHKGADLCEPCPPNSYRAEPGAAELVACLQCPAAASTRGLVGQSSRAACVCDSGYYPEIGVDMPKCQPCPIGAAECNGTGLVAPEGSRWATEGSEVRLVGCPAGTVLVRNNAFAVADECVSCPFGKYSIVAPVYPGVLSVKSASAASEQCLLCERGLQCDGATNITARRGYWLANDFQSANRRSDGVAANSSAETPEHQTKAIVVPCPPYACQDGGICAEGHGGPVCAICEPGWVMTGNRCHNCGSSNDVRTLRIVMGFTAGLLFLAVFFRMAVQPAIHGEELEEAHCLSSCCTNGLGAKVLAWFKENFWDVRDHCKVIISFFQVVSTYHTSTSSHWGPSSSLFDNAAIFRLGLSNLPLISCTGIGSSYQDLLLLYTVTPILICALLASPLPILRLIGSPNLSYCIDHSYKVVGAFLFLAYPTISIKSISAFNCHRITDDMNLLIADYRELCPNDNPSGFLFSYSVICVLIFPVGIICGAFWVMKRFRVPQLAQQKVNEARIHSMILLYIKQRADLDRNLPPMTPISADFRPASSNVAVRTSRRISQARFQHITSETCGDSDLESSRGNQDRKVTVGLAGITDDGYCFFEGNEVENDLSESQIISLLTHDWRHTPTCPETSDLELWTAKVTISGMEAWTGHHLRQCSRTKLLSLLRESAMLLTAGGVLAVPAVKWDPDSTNEAESQAAQRLGFLMMTYKPQYWYMELIELWRKFFTACALVFIWRRSVRQTAIVLAVTFVALIATMKLQPYRSHSVLNTQIFSLCVQCTTLLYGVMNAAIEATEDKPPEQEDRGGYTMLLVLFWMVPAFPFLFAAMRRLRNEWVRHTLVLTSNDGKDSPQRASSRADSPAEDVEPGSNPPSESVRAVRAASGLLPRTRSNDSVFSRRSICFSAPAVQDVEGKDLSMPGSVREVRTQSPCVTMSAAPEPCSLTGTSSRTALSLSPGGSNPVVGADPGQPQLQSTAWDGGGIDWDGDGVEGGGVVPVLKTLDADSSEQSDSDREDTARSEKAKHPESSSAGQPVGVSAATLRGRTRAESVGLPLVGLEISETLQDSQALRLTEDPDQDAWSEENSEVVT